MDDNNTTIVVNDVVHEIPPEAPQIESPVERQPQAETTPKQSPKAICQANELMLKLGIHTVGAALKGIAPVEGVEFSPDEENTLIEAWRPFLNIELPPVYVAAICSLIIVGGKVVKVVAYRRAQKTNSAKQPA